MLRIIAATNNQGKVFEIKKICENLPIDICSLKDIGLSIDVEEDQPTFEENAAKKAVEVMKETGHIALADDSGLEVDILDGKPGVLTARFAGPHATDQENNKKLLDLLNGVPAEKRKAVFRCFMVLACPNGEIFKAEGSCFGSIAFRPSGSGGFGYDPIFIVNSLGKTFAELTAEEKNKISHRAIALNKIKNIISKILYEDECK